MADRRLDPGTPGANPMCDSVAPASNDADSCMIEMRLALHFCRHHFGRDHWRLYLLQPGRA